MRKIVVLLLILTIVFSGCSKKEDKKSDNDVQKPPEVLATLEESLLTLMGKIDIAPSINNAIEDKKKNEALAEQKELQLAQASEHRLPEDDKKETNEEKEAKSIKIASYTQNSVIFNMLKSENIKEITDLDKQEVPLKLQMVWDDIKKDLQKIHKSWNELKSKMGSVPVEKERYDAFESNLNALTDSVNKYDILNSLIYANTLTSYLADFKNYYKNLVSNDVDKMKYSVRKSALLTSMSDYDNAIKTIDASLELLSQKSNKIYSKDKELFLKLKYSLEDIKKSILAKDLKLLNIKAPIAIENINQIKNIQE